MALAQEVARKGVTVNTVSPGYIATEMVLGVPEEIRKKIVDQIPVGRMGTPWPARWHFSPRPRLPSSPAPTSRATAANP
jgi:NAD(P)-dependent dehydrogenase (short-subunit alcohol dehydrogenase family)